MIEYWTASSGTNSSTTYGPVPIGFCGEGGRRVAARAEDVLGQDAAALRGREVAVPAELRLVEGDLHRLIVDGLDGVDRLIEGGVRRLVGGVDDPFPGEDDVAGGEWLAVAPEHPVQQVVGDGGEVGGDQPVLQ